MILDQFDLLSGIVDETDETTIASMTHATFPFSSSSFPTKLLDGRQRRMIELSAKVFDNVDVPQILKSDDSESGLENRHANDFGGADIRDFFVPAIL